jgi:hypothetical protein
MARPVLYKKTWRKTCEETTRGGYQKAYPMWHKRQSPVRRGYRQHQHGAELVTSMQVPYVRACPTRAAPHQDIPVGPTYNNDLPRLR